MSGERMLALDTEDDGQGVPYIINFFDGERHTTFVRDEARGESPDRLRLRAWNWLYAQAPKGSGVRLYVWACNAEYDLINVFGRWLGKMVTLQYVSSGLLRGMLRDRRVTFFDTLRHWPMSVEAMGDFLGYPKMAKDFRSVEYCRTDTEIVHRFASQMIARYTALGLDVRATLPSMALQLFAKKFYRRDFVMLPPPLVDWLRQGYYGGRVEVYRFGKIEGPVHHYDVNSLFPSVMVEGRYPDPASYTTTTRPDFDREGMADVVVRVPESEYPPLPVRGASDILYPYGTLAGVWCYPEIRRAIEDGADILSVRRAVEFRPMATPFREYVEYCYAQRKRARHVLDDVLWKLYMNSLYGKFGQKPGLEMIYDDRNITLETKPSAAANVVWAAYVTCLARVRLLGHLRSTSACYYTDTDSLFTPDTLPTSAKLGGLKQEGVYESMEAVGNKMYAVTVSDEYLAGMKPRDRRGFVREGDHHTRYKAKGVKMQDTGADGVTHHVARDFIRTGRATFRKPARFRESRRTSAVANRWYEVEKVRQAVYTKRRVAADGTTRPWKYQEYVEVHGG
ncbi:MAG: hypothetical protein L0214_07615 [candidate division NC10 bacterium]|nr:hypothetical protein [candidate division NC10 bacterium]